MVTSCVGENTLNCLMMIGNLYDNIIEAKTEKLYIKHWQVLKKRKSF